jgi:hypothetical protein
MAALLLAATGLGDSHAAGPWRADASNTAGWLEMSPAERVEHQRRLRSFGSFEECTAYETAQRRRVRERASGGRGAPASSPPPRSQPRPAASPPSAAASAPGAEGCEQLRAQGRWR